MPPRALLLTGCALLAGQLLVSPCLKAGPNVPRYSVRVIEEPEGARFSASRVEALNNKGELVLWADLKSREQRAFLWQDGKLTNLGGLGGSSTIPRGMNDHGHVVGCATTATGETHAFLWRDGKLQDLGAEPGGNSEAWDINNLGVVVGNAEEPVTKLHHAVLWTRGVRHPLPDSGKSSSATFVNDALVILGNGLDRDGGSWHAFSWIDGRVRDVGVAPGYETSGFWGLNEHGQGVGYFSRGGSPHTPGENRPFVYKDHRAADAPILEKAGVIPFGINASGQIIGGGGGAPYAVRGAYLLDGDRLLPLNDLVRDSGWKIIAATHINDRGQITALGEREGERRALLLSPQR